jgi:site-specific DNA recombinase
MRSLSDPRQEDQLPHIEQLLKARPKLATTSEAGNSMAKSEASAQLGQQIAALQRGIGRLIDSYAAGVIDRSEFEPRLAGLRSRVAHLQEQQRVAVEAVEAERELTLIMGQFEDFAAKVRHGLDDLDWLSTRAVIRALVRRVEIDQDDIKVVFRVPPSTNSGAPQPSGQTKGKSAVRQDCTAGRGAQFGLVPPFHAAASCRATDERFGCS